MARGWESKSVEEMVEARNAERDAATRPVESPAELERRQRREGIEMSRARIVRELEGARNERHREMLERSLQHLDVELAALDSEPLPS